MTSDTQLLSLLPGLIGYSGGKVGVILVLRNNGDEALFASPDGEGLCWIPTSSFAMAPESIRRPQDLKRLRDKELDP